MQDVINAYAQAIGKGDVDKIMALRGRRQDEMAGFDPLFECEQRELKNATTPNRIGAVAFDR